MAKPAAKKPSKVAAKPVVRKPRPSAVRATPAAANPPETEAVVEGSEAAFHAFLPQALALAPAEVAEFHADVSLASRNVDAGVAAVIAARASIEARVSKTDWAAIAALPNLGLAVCFAARRVELSSAVATGTPALLAEARTLRRKLVTSADALAESGLLPEAQVAKAHRGRGPRNTASDLEDLAALFEKNAAAIKGRHPITAAQLARAKVVGATLLKVLRPKAAPRSAKSTETAAAIDARDRLWTLLEKGYTEVRRLGMWQWVDDVDAHVPALQAHRGRGRPHKKAASGGGAGATGPTGPTGGAVGKS